MAIKTNMLTNLQKFQNKIIQRQLQIRMKKKPKEKYISPEKRQEIIDDLRLK